MILQICYNPQCVDLPTIISNLCKEKYPEITVETYDESHYKENTKAYKIKGGYSARMTPFMLLTNDDKTYIKAFYSEDKECTVDKFVKFINKYYESTSN